MPSPALEMLGLALRESTTTITRTINAVNRSLGASTTFRSLSTCVKGDLNFALRPQQQRRREQQPYSDSTQQIDRFFSTEADPPGPGPPKQPIEVLPLPEGISGDEFQFLEVLDSAPENVEGLNTVIAIHGPPELMTNQKEPLYGANGGCFAVIEAGGTQHKVSADNAVYINRIAGEVNTQVTFDKVLLLGSVAWTVFGRPYIPFARVIATIEEQTLSGKVMVTKFKRRKGYTRRQGHRQKVTRLRINHVQFDMPGKKDIIPHEIKLDPLRPNLPNNPTYT